MKRRSRLLKHFLALTILSSLVLALTPGLIGSSFAGENNQCRQQANGNKHKGQIVQVTCLFNAETGDITVTIEGNRALSDAELDAVVTVVEGDIQILNVCKSHDSGDINDCLDIIVTDVVTVSGTFIGFDLFGACAKHSKGNSKCKK